jgi:flagella basal body P-ring formation protein FlgA
VIRAIVLILVLVGSCVARAGTVTLRQSAIFDGHGSLTLGDVADLDGEDVRALSEVELGGLEGAGRVHEVTLDRVRDALDAHGVNWGRVALRGASCTVRLTRQGRAQNEDEKEESRRIAEPVDIDMPPTVRTRVAVLLCRLFGVENADLRVLFDDGDEVFLDTPEWGRRIEVQPNSVGASSRQSLTVRVYEGEHLVESRTIRADVTIRRRVVVVGSGLARREVIERGDVSLQTLWMEPDGTPPVARLEDAVGMLTQSRVKAGSVLRESQIEMPVLVRRGERVTVHCLNGGVALRVQARALRDGKRGEQIECVLDGRDRTFTARVSDRGVAVMVLDGDGSDVARGDME